MGSNELYPVLCSMCGATKNVGSYYVPSTGKTWFYYEHVEPDDCIRYLRSLLDDIGSRRIV